MEQILAFVLGVVAVAFVWVVSVMFKTKSEVNKIKQLQSELENGFNEIEKKIDSRVDKAESRLDARIADLVAFTDLNGHAISKLQLESKKSVETKKKVKNK